MERPGEKFRRARERLKLTYRQVAEASQAIAARRGSDEFAIALSRLADIENKGTVPSIYRLYTLCAVYRLDFQEVLRWYGVPLDQLAAESLQTGIAATHAIQFTPGVAMSVPVSLDCEIDLNKTTYLSQLIRRWGKMPFHIFNNLDFRQRRYGLIGLEDRSMFPILQPGALVLIDDRRRKIAAGGWTNEFDRPIYFLEHRSGFICGWCTLADSKVLVQPHPASQQQPSIFGFPAEIEVIGQVTGVAMLLESRKRHHPLIPQGHHDFRR